MKSPIFRHVLRPTVIHSVALVAACALTACDAGTQPSPDPASPKSATATPDAASAGEDPSATVRASSATDAKLAHATITVTGMK